MTYAAELIDVAHAAFDLLSDSEVSPPLDDLASAAVAERPSVGDVVVGTITKVTNAGYYVELAFPIAAFLPRHEVGHWETGAPRWPSQGERIEAAVVSLSDDRIHLSQRALEVRPLMADYKPGDTVTGTVTWRNEATALIDVGHVRGVLPVFETSWESGGEQLPELGDEISAVVVGLQPKIGSLALSTRRLSPSPLERYVEALAPGDRIPVQVVEVDERRLVVRVAGSSTVAIRTKEFPRGPAGLTVLRQYRPGDSTEATVVATDPVLVLSMRWLDLSGWRDVSPGLRVGEVMRVKVVDDRKWGYRVEARGWYGHVRRADISPLRTAVGEGPFYPGDEVDAVLVGIDEDRQRMLFSLMEHTEATWRGMAATLPVGSETDAKVLRVVKFGVFVELAPGFNALAHASTFEPEATSVAPALADTFIGGQAVRVRILARDPERYRTAVAIIDQPHGSASDGCRTEHR